MKKIYVFLLFLFIFPFYVQALEYPKTNSKIVEIYDLTDNKVLYEINSSKKSSIASLTKIVTTITAIENINNLEEKVMITDDILSTVRWDASIAGLKSGDIVTYRDLLYASMLPSGADATNSIAILSSDSVDNFVNKMNELVKGIGVDNTHFVNVTGLDDDNHYSTADDIMKILIYSLNNPLFKEIYTTKEYTLSNGLKVSSTLKMYTKYSNLNINKILGSKTGFTINAGYCLSSLSSINKHDILIIVLNATHENNLYYNIVDTVNLIDFIEKNYNQEILVNKDDLIKVIPVNLSKIDNYEILANNNIEKYLPSDYDKNNLRIEYNGLENLSYKNKFGDKIGTINYYYGDELIKSEDVILNTKLEISIIKILIKYYYILVLFLILLIIFIGRKIIIKKDVNIN